MPVKGSDYIVAFGSGFAHKNMRGLLEAYGLARDAGLKHRLVIVGRLGPEDSSSISDSHASAIDVTGYVPADELDTLLRGAALLVFPSRYEGFGLPILEAMHRDVPVVCSDRASIPEVAGGAALYFNPDDPAAMATAIRRVCEDGALARELATRGRERARMFDWKQSAERVLEVYRDAIADRAGTAGSRPAGRRSDVLWREVERAGTSPPAT
jgi:glycosyltransferase involved in cell wall biosynthesis